MTLVGDYLVRAVDAAHEAIVFTEGDRGCSYGELAADAGRVAHALQECGVGRGDRVGVALDGGYDVLVSLYGILDAGAVYVPLGGSAAPERLAGIARDAGLTALIDGRPTAEAGSVGAAGTPILRHGVRGESLLDARLARGMSWEEVQRGDAGAKVRRAREDDLAYIFYTSGSTGEPKGVSHEHRSACAFAEWARATLITEADARVAGVSAITFDISLLELVASVARGASIVGVPRRLAIFPGAFAHAIAEASPTVLQLVPRLWRGLLGAPEALASVRVGVVTGERMAPPDWEALRAAAPRARLFNVYGSTEANDCACFELPREWSQGAGEVPIGYPVTGASIELAGSGGSLGEEVGAGGAGRLGDAGHVGETNGESVGEVIVASAMLMRGYWNLPGETDGRVVTLADGRRAFRTGDLARRDADGVLHMEGRIDRAVKLGGEWVRLDEVEAVLARHPAVTEVLAVVDDAGVRSGVRVVVATSSEVDPVELQSHCAIHLPRPAWPQRVELVSALPRNQHGKVDLKAGTRNGT